MNRNDRRHCLMTADIDCGGAADRVTHGNGTIDSQFALEYTAGFAVLIQNPFKSGQHGRIIARVIRTTGERIASNHHKSMRSDAGQEFRVHAYL